MNGNKPSLLKMINESKGGRSKVTAVLRKKSKIINDKRFHILLVDETASIASCIFLNSKYTRRFTYEEFIVGQVYLFTLSIIPKPKQVELSASIYDAKVIEKDDNLHMWYKQYTCFPSANDIFPSIKSLNNNIPRIKVKGRITTIFEPITCSTGSILRTYSITDERDNINVGVFDEEEFETNNILCIQNAKIEKLDDSIYYRLTCDALSDIIVQNSNSKSPILKMKSSETPQLSETQVLETSPQIETLSQSSSILQSPTQTSSQSSSISQSPQRSHLHDLFFEDLRILLTKTPTENCIKMVSFLNTQKPHIEVSNELLIDFLTESLMEKGNENKVLPIFYHLIKNTTFTKDVLLNIIRFIKDHVSLFPKSTIIESLNELEIIPIEAILNVTRSLIMSLPPKRSCNTRRDLLNLFPNSSEDDDDDDDECKKGKM